MPPIDPSNAATFASIVSQAGPMAAMLVILTVCIISIHRFVFRDVLATHSTVSENGKLTAASMSQAASEHRVGSEAAKSTAGINLQMLELLRGIIADMREKK